MTREELEKKLKQVIRDKTLHDDSYVVMYLLPVIDEYVEEKIIEAKKRGDI